MRFFTLVAGAAFAAVAYAQSPVNITNVAIAPEAGKPFTITYTPPTIQVTVLLKNGPSGNLKTVGEIGTSSSGSVTWNVPSNLPNEQYAFEIKPATGDSNYSGQFSVKGATAAVSSAASSTTRSASSSSSSGSASSSVTRSTGSASASASPSGNSTISVPTLSTSSSGRPTASSATTTGNAPPQSTGGAATLAQSPLALILGAAAAIAYLA